MTPVWLHRLAQSISDRLPILKRLPPWSYWLTGLAILGGLIIISSAASSLGNTSTVSLNPFVYSINVFLKLILVLLLIYALAHIFRSGKTVLPGRPTRQIAILETTRISSHQALHLVKVGDRTLLIGATDQNMSLLSELDAPMDDLELNSSTQKLEPGLAKSKPPFDFASLLHQ